MPPKVNIVVTENEGKPVVQQVSLITEDKPQADAKAMELYTRIKPELKKFARDIERKGTEKPE